EREIAPEPARHRAVGEDVGRERHPADADADPPAERVARVQVGPAVHIVPAGRLAEAEPDQQADPADHQPGRPGKTARRGEHLGRQEKDAGPDDAVDPQPDQVEQGHPSSGHYFLLLPNRPAKKPFLPEAFCSSWCLSIFSSSPLSKKIPWQAWQRRAFTWSKVESTMGPLHLGQPCRGGGGIERALTTSSRRFCDSTRAASSSARWVVRRVCVSRSDCSSSAVRDPLARASASSFSRATERSVLSRICDCSRSASARSASDSAAVALPFLCGFAAAFFAAGFFDVFLAVILAGMAAYNARIPGLKPNLSVRRA